VMNEGVIQQCDTPLGLYNRPVKRFVAGFIGSPPMNFLELGVEEAGEQLWVCGAGFRLRVDGQHAQRLRQYVGREVIFGIRPTDIREAAGDRSEDMQGGRCVEARVEVMEPTGADTLAYLDVAGNSLLASLDSATEAVEGQALMIAVDMAKCHYFDMDTEESILWHNALPDA
jgi:multiple sugar transport system ATP-binding protein